MEGQEVSTGCLRLLWGWFAGYRLPTPFICPIVSSLPFPELTLSSLLRSITLTPYSPRQLPLLELLSLKNNLEDLIALLGPVPRSRLGAFSSSGGATGAAAKSDSED